MIKLIALALLFVPRVSIGQQPLSHFPAYDRVTVLVADDWSLYIVNLRPWDDQPLEQLKRWWQQVEECVGKKRDFNTVTWYLADMLWGRGGEMFSGSFIFPPAEIVLVDTSRLVIKHEMTHAISMEVRNQELAILCSLGG